MDRSPIRHIATSYSGSKCAAATFEHLVSIWDIDDQKKISQFDTCLDFGGRRLAISEDGRLVAAGAYKYYGIAIHRSCDGTLFWQRKDLKRVQYIRFDPGGGHLLACIDGAPCHFIDMLTGQTIQTYKGVKSIEASPYHKNIIALEKKKRVYIIEIPTEREIFFIEEESFAALSIVFSPNSVFISEAAGPLRCFNLKNGSLIWRHDPAGGCHFLRIAYSERNRMLYGVLRSFENGDNDKIYWLDVSTGKIQGQKIIKGLAVESEFAQKGNMLITSDGDVYDLCDNSGPIINKHLDFNMIKQ